MKTLLDNKITHIFVTDTRTILLWGDQVLYLSVGTNALSERLVEQFFMSENLRGFLWKNFAQSGKSFSTSGHQIWKNICIFSDIIAFFMEVEATCVDVSVQYLVIPIEKQYFFFHKKHAWILAGYFSQYISPEIYQNIHEVKQAYKSYIFFQDTYLRKRFRVLQDILKKREMNGDLSIHENEIVHIKNGKFRKITINESEHNKIALPWMLLNSNLLYAHDTTIQVKKYLFSPIVKLYAFSGSRIWHTGFWYGSTYRTADVQNLFRESVQNFWTWYSYESKELAKIKAFVEWFERYNSWDIWWNTHPKDIFINHVLASKIIGNNYCIPDECFATEIYPIEIQGNDIKILDFSEHIPSELVYYPYYHRVIPYFSNSSGVWAGRNYEEAFSRGLLELSERDSLMLTWLLKLTPDIIATETLPTFLQKRIYEAEQFAQGKITIFNISYDKTIPHVLIFFQYAHSEIIYCWASAGLSCVETICKALDEVLVNIYFWEHNIPEIKNIWDIHNVSDHRYFYCQHNNIQYLDFLFWKNQYVSYWDFEWNFKVDFLMWDVVAMLEKVSAGKFFVANLTTQYSQRLGIHIVRVLSEWLIPIWFWGHNILPLKKPRLQNPFFRKFQRHMAHWEIPDFLHFFD